jgi:hypothetical protein
MALKTAQVYKMMKQDKTRVGVTAACCRVFRSFLRLANPGDVATIKFGDNLVLLACIAAEYILALFCCGCSSGSASSEGGRGELAGGMSCTASAVVCK